jgi:hypothetical protein
VPSVLTEARVRGVRIVILTDDWQTCFGCNGLGLCNCVACSDYSTKYKECVACMGTGCLTWGRPWADQEVAA